MKQLFLVLCVIIMFFGIVGYPSSDKVTPANNNSGFASTAVASVYGEPTTGSSPAALPEPATLLLLGFGLISLAIVGRKSFKK